MYTLLLLLILATAILLCLVILLQSGKGGGLASTFGGTSSSTESFMGGRKAANLLTRLSWVGGGVFLFLALVLSVLSARQGDTSESILQNEVGGAPQQQVPQSPSSVLEAEGNGSGQQSTDPSGESDGSGGQGGSGGLPQGMGGSGGSGGSGGPGGS